MRKQLYVLVSLCMAIGLALGACAPQQSSGAPRISKAVTLKVWHGWTDPNELALLNAAIDTFQKANPKATVDVLAVPFDQLKNKFTTEASTGGGPDLLIGPKDWIGELTNAKLVAELDTVAQSVLADLNPAAVEANKFKGKVMALPESVEAVVLWYNKDMVKDPPKTTDDLLTAAGASGLALNTGFYHSVGFLFAFGGSIFDTNQKCVFDQGSGVADYLDFMAAAKAAKGTVADSDGGKLDAAFKDKKVGMIFNGPWATGDYSKALGADKLGVAAPLKIPKTGKTFAPFLGTKNLFLSSNSKGDAQAAAILFMKVMVSPDIQANQAVKAGHIPSNKSVKASDPLVAGIIAQTQSASYFPNEPEMGAVWGPAGDMIIKVIEGKSKSADAVKEAAGLINNANKK
jgi:arabinogalactan oligomer / maltooligosaccharide transport system substrate-binding protein